MRDSVQLKPKKTRDSGKPLRLIAAEELADVVHDGAGSHVVIGFLVRDKPNLGFRVEFDRHFQQLGEIPRCIGGMHTDAEAGGNGALVGV